MHSVLDSVILSPINRSNMYGFLRKHPRTRVGSELACRLFLEAVLWRARTHRAWRTLPPTYGHWGSVYQRFAAWCDKGVWKDLHKHFQDDPNMCVPLLDSLMEQVHARATRKLRIAIVRSLQTQGFQVCGRTIALPQKRSKDQLRTLHATAVRYKIERAPRELESKEERLLQHLAVGGEIDPECIRPHLEEVHPGSEEELLFRYASLHWSIPISSGYGKRLRFLVIDGYNKKLMGLIGLGDPVYSLSPRDEWIGWTLSDRKERLRNVMDAFVLGAVPPYSFLLCGKLVAMLATSDTIRHAFKQKYEGTRSLIKRKVHDGNLALVTTTSALGRSSLYNRLRLAEGLLYERVGFTQGSGEFHFSNGIYDAMAQFVQEHCEPTAKQERWGTGFRNRREVIRKCLPALGLSSDWLYHGVEREVFVAPLAHNTRAFLRGECSELKWRCHSVEDIFCYFRKRWLLPRAERNQQFKSWSPTNWVLWPKREYMHG